MVPAKLHTLHYLPDIEMLIGEWGEGIRPKMERSSISDYIEAVMVSLLIGSGHADRLAFG